MHAQMPQLCWAAFHCIVLRPCASHLIPRPAVRQVAFAVCQRFATNTSAAHKLCGLPTARLEAWKLPDDVFRVTVMAVSRCLHCLNELKVERCWREWASMVLCADLCPISARVFYYKLSPSVVNFINFFSCLEPNLQFPYSNNVRCRNAITAGPIWMRLVAFDRDS